MVTTIKMSVPDWINVKPNPIQRDTVRHASKAHHLETFIESHAVVSAAKLPNDDLIKLDGHTRAYMWKHKLIKQPSKPLTVIVHDVKNMAEAEALYKTFDGKAALETENDKVSGAFNNLGFTPQSSLLRSFAITNALRIAYLAQNGFALSTNGTKKGTNAKAVYNTDQYTMVKEFIYELSALDALMPSKGSTPGGAVAAFIMSYRKYGGKVVPFWKGLFAGEGTKINGAMDPIQATLELLMSRKKYGILATSDVTARILFAVEKYLKGAEMHTVPKALNTTGYLDKIVNSPRLIKR